MRRFLYCVALLAILLCGLALRSAELSIRKETKLFVGQPQFLIQSTEWFAWPIYPTRDGGFLVVSENHNGETTLARLDSSQALVWSTFFGRTNFGAFRSGVEANDGTFLFATGGRQIVIADTNGIARSVSLPPPGTSQRVVRSRTGYIVGGELAGSGPQGTIFVGLGTDLQIEWQTPVFPI